VTKKNWRMDCGVAGYDNTLGCHPSFQLTCVVRITSTDCGYSRMASAPRMWMPRRITQEHYMRNPPAAEILNEEVSNLLKRKSRTRSRVWTS